MSRRRFYLNSLLITALCSLVVVFVATVSVIAKPLTGSGVIGTMVYQGVALVTSGESGSSVLELGNNGQEIASSGDIYLRPNYLPATSGSVLQAIKFVKNATTGRTDVYAPGGVCFASGTCQDTWPTGGGTSLWNLVSGQRLETATAGRTVSFVKNNPSSATANAVELVAQNTDTVFGVSNTFGIAAQFSQGALIQGNVIVDKRSSGDEFLMVNTDTNTSYKVWHYGNDGHTSSATGLDASKLDGTPIIFYHFPTTSLASCGSNGTDRHCFCGNFFSGTTTWRCIKLQ